MELAILREINADTLVSTITRQRRQNVIAYMPSHSEKGETKIFIWKLHTGLEPGTHVWLAQVKRFQLYTGEVSMETSLIL